MRKSWYCSCFHHLGLDICFDEYNYHDSLQTHSIVGIDHFKLVSHIHCTCNCTVVRHYQGRVGMGGGGDTIINSFNIVLLYLNFKFNNIGKATLKHRIWNQELESGIWNPESRIQNPESRICNIWGEIFCCCLFSLLHFNNMHCKNNWLNKCSKGG